MCKGLLNFNNIKMYNLITNGPNISIDNFPRKEIKKVRRQTLLVIDHWEMKNKEILLHTYYTAPKPERALILQNSGENAEKPGFPLFVGRKVCWKTVWNCLIKFIKVNMFFHNHQIQSFVFIQGD